MLLPAILPGRFAVSSEISGASLRAAVTQQNKISRKMI
jgi:hypothetical protein